jgi:Zn-dependent M16 (insulinase) family peptidase
VLCEQGGVSPLTFRWRCAGQTGMMADLPLKENSMPFELRQTRAIPGIQATFEEYEHETGLRHVHVRRQDNERGFMLVFPTPPGNDRGIPHILEHLALAGSERYPIRNPFFSMLRRSTASFINAMTGETFTMYPFATTNENDYWNLMAVYSDATFFPNLDRLDFMQEGWRDTIDENGKLAVAGVVYNEMLGALNARDARLEIEVDRLWSAGQPNAFVSGGEPLAIPSLSHEELKQFHAEHYHPSRAVLLTYGNFDAVEVQARFQEMVIARRQWEKFPAIVPVPRQAPATKSAIVSVPQEGDGNEHSLTFLWQIDNAAPVDRLLVSAMNNLALSQGGPLNALLESSDFCRAGHVAFSNEDDHAVLRIELHGLAPEDIERGHALVKQALAAAIAEDHSTQQVEATLRDFEFNERNPGGKMFGMPFGIAKLYITGRNILAGRDGITAFDNSATLDQLHEQLRVPGAVARWLDQNINRPADLCIHGEPDPEFSERYAAQLVAVAKSHEDALTPERREQIIRDGKALVDRQAAPSDLSCLPGLVVEDLSLSPREVLPLEFIAGNATAPAELGVKVPANGQVYLGVSLDISKVPVEDFRWVDLLVDLSASLGAGHMEWAEATRWRELSAVGASSSVHVVQTARNQDVFGLEAVFETVGLQRDIPAMSQVMKGMIYDTRLDERERIKQVLGNALDQSSQELSQKGNEWTVLEMSRPLSPIHSFRADLAGRQSHAWLASVCEKLDDPAREDEVFQALERAKQHLASAPLVVRAACEDPSVPIAVMRNVFSGRAGWEEPQGSQAVRYEVSQPRDIALAGKTSVQYMHQAWKVPPMVEKDTGHLAVLSQVLSMDCLHSAVRERGGAYGSAAKYDNSASFSMMSYRDPRLSGTLSDFTIATQWVQTDAVNQDMVNSAIIAVCRALDAPTSLATAAQESWAMLRSGVSYEDRSRFRQEVLGANVEQVRAAASKLFAANPLVRAGFIGESLVDEAREVGLSVEPLSPTQSLENPSMSSPRLR